MEMPIPRKTLSDLRWLSIRETFLKEATQENQALGFNNGNPLTYEGTPHTSSRDIGLDVARILLLIFCPFFLIPFAILLVDRAKYIKEINMYNAQLVGFRGIRGLEEEDAQDAKTAQTAEAAEAAQTIQDPCADFYSTDDFHFSCKPEEFIEQMKRDVAYSKPLVIQEAMSILKNMRFSEAFCASRILKNLFIGGSSANFGYFDLGKYPQFPITSQQNKKVLERAFEYYGDPEGLRAQLKETPFASHFIEYHSHEGNGFFGYVYSTNGQGLKMRDDTFDNEGNNSCSRNVYLKSNYQDNEERWFDGELHFDFDKEGQNGDKYDILLPLIDKAVDILIQEDRKETGAEPMMVHCSSGAERSVTTVIAIIIRWFQRNNIDITDDLVDLVADFIRTRRPTAATFEDTLPNPDAKSVHEMRKRLIQYLRDNPPQHDGGGGGGSK